MASAELSSFRRANSEPGNLAAAATYLERERAVALAAAWQADWRVITIAGATDMAADRFPV